LDLAFLGQHVVILDPAARSDSYLEETPLLVPADSTTITAMKSETKAGSITNTGGSLSPGLTTHLSDREQQILLRLARGEANKIIARLCSITEATVKAHVKAILRKIAVQNRTQAALWAIENGLVGAAENLPANDPRVEHAGLQQFSSKAKLAD